jgi:hypothetical protein
MLKQIMEKAYVISEMIGLDSSKIWNGCVLCLFYCDVAPEMWLFSPFIYGKNRQSRFQWPSGLRRGSAADRLLRLLVRIPPGHGCFSVVSVVCCQVEVSATGWSLVQRSPTDCGVSLCVIKRNNNPLHLLWLGRKGLDEERKKKKEERQTVLTLRSCQVVTSISE